MGEHDTLSVANKGEVAVLAPRQTLLNVPDHKVWSRLRHLHLLLRLHCAQRISERIYYVLIITLFNRIRNKSRIFYYSMVAPPTGSHCTARAATPQFCWFSVFGLQVCLTLSPGLVWRGLHRPKHSGPATEVAACLLQTDKLSLRQAVNVWV